MSCPFGYGKSAVEHDEETDNDILADDEDESELEQETKPQAQTTTTSKTKKAGGCPFGHIAAASSDEDERFNYDKDPISWFYQNQIKSEEQFQKRKASLQAAAKKRLEGIMEKKGKKIAFDSNSDMDSLSIRSSELSDLQSDVDSLKSLASCAESWIEEAKYCPRAESLIKYSCVGAIAVACDLVWQSSKTSLQVRRVQGILDNSWWYFASSIAAVVTGIVLILMYLAATYRSRRMLLAAKCGLLVTYSAVLALGVSAMQLPTVINENIRKGVCARSSTALESTITSRPSPLCHMLPMIQRQLAEAHPILLRDLGIVAIACLLILGLGMWYQFEISYIEKKAIKHKRRHKRRKKSIPWHKIKIIGPVTKCGG